MSDDKKIQHEGEEIALEPLAGDSTDKLHDSDGSPSTLTAINSQSKLKEGPSSSDMPTLYKNISDLGTFAGDSKSDRVETLVNSENVVIFAKTTCGFCSEAISIFEKLRVPFVVVNLDKIPKGFAYHGAVQKFSGVRTVPVVYIKQELIGGCSDLKTLEVNGELYSKVSSLVERSQTDEYVVPFDRPWDTKKRAIAPLFCFPDTVNNNQIRMIGFQVFIIAVFGAVFWDNRGMHWAIAALLGDFILRFLFGAFFSPIGAIAGLVVCKMKPDFRPGPPKQFASLCGIMFSGMATILFFAGDGRKGTDIAGAVVCGMLAGAAGMEAFLDFCAGCLMFGWMVQFNLLKGTVYKMHVNMKDETEAFYELNHTNHKYPDPEVRILSKEGKEDKEMGHDQMEEMSLLEANPSSIQYKKKPNEYWQEQVHFIKYCHISYFIWALAIVTQAVVFRFSVTILDLPDELWYTVGLIGAILFIVLLGLYLLKALMFTKKCRKELYCPLRGPMFGVIPLIIMLLGNLISEWTTTFGKVLIWGGVISLLVLSITGLAYAIRRNLNSEHIQLTWLILPVGNFIGAFLLILIDPNWVEPANALYSFALFMFVALFAITLNKGITDHHSDNRLRTNYFMWVASAGAASLASTVIVNEFTGKFFYFVGFAFMLSLTYLIFPLKFLLRGSFPQLGMGLHAVSFSINALALSGIVYHTQVNTGLTIWLAYMGLVAGAWMTFVLSVHTIVALLHGFIFRPELKWGPFSGFNRLAHESMRGVSKKLTILASDPGVEFVKLWKDFEVLHHSHALLEDKYLFPLIASFAPAHPTHAEEEHEEHRQAFAEIDALIEKNALAEIEPKLTKLLEELEEHMIWEEKNLQPVGRKYIPLANQKEVVRQMWDELDGDTWRLLVPMIVHYMPYHTMRVRWIKSLIWAMPSHAQQIGLYIYQGCSDVTWVALSTELPEIIPRTYNGADECSWVRHY